MKFVLQNLATIFSAFIYKKPNRRKEKCTTICHQTVQHVQGQGKKKKKNCLKGVGRWSTKWAKVDKNCKRERESKKR